MKMIFSRLVRFKDANGRILYGEAPEEENLLGCAAPVYEGDHPWDLKETDEVPEIVEVLCPLSNTPLIYGVGLNYKTHIAEAQLAQPQFPTIFLKPPDALNLPYGDIAISPECPNIDYEGELTVVIGKDARDVRADRALDYVLGYTVGNDVSSRYWQMPERSGQQHGYAKSFDGFAPIGPVVVSTDSVDPDRLVLKTTVNGEERQRSCTGDLLFKVGDLVEHLSRATTLRAGTVIMTGTPGGIAAMMKPPAWLQDGDVAEVSISGIGNIRNRFAFGTPRS